MRFLDVSKCVHVYILPPMHLLQSHLYPMSLQFQSLPQSQSLLDVAEAPEAAGLQQPACSATDDTASHCVHVRAASQSWGNTHMVQQQALAEVHHESRALMGLCR